MSEAMGSILPWLDACRRRRSIAAEAFRATLAGLSGVHVQVEPINADAERAGLTGEALKADVESVLQQARLAIHTRTALFTDVPGTPMLHVDVMTVPLDGRFAYTVRLELWQAVRLARNPAEGALALTWSAPQVVGTLAAERIVELRKIVREAAEGFVQEWRAATADPIRLPRPAQDGQVGSLAAALATRRSVRSYVPQPLTLEEIAQLLWAAQGITHPSGLRSAPSAGALYPLEVFLVAGDVEGLPDGIYRYVPRDHALALVGRGDCRHALAAAALHQASIEQAPATVAVTAVYGRTTPRYGERGVRYVHMEVGHLAQNVCLQARALGLGAVVVGAFHDDEVKRVVGAGADEEPVCLLPVGRPGDDTSEVTNIAESAWA